MTQNYSTCIYLSKPISSDSSLSKYTCFFQFNFQVQSLSLAEEVIYLNFWISKCFIHLFCWFAELRLNGNIWNHFRDPKLCKFISMWLNPLSYPQNVQNTMRCFNSWSRLSGLVYLLAGSFLPFLNELAGCYFLWIRLCF